MDWIQYSSGLCIIIESTDYNLRNSRIRNKVANLVWTSYIIDCTKGMFYVSSFELTSFCCISWIISCFIALVSNNGTEELFHASSWGYTFSWRKYCSDRYENFKPMFMLLLSIGTFNTLFNGKRYLAWHSAFDIFGLFLCGTPVFKFVEHPENNEKQTDQKSKVKFKIMSLKVKEIMDYVPELVSDPSDFNYHFWLLMFYLLFTLFHSWQVVFLLFFWNFFNCIVDISSSILFVT